MHAYLLRFQRILCPQKIMNKLNFRFIKSIESIQNNNVEIDAC
jgi:hypothetical protein